jgi:hypothetical protein
MSNNANGGFEPETGIAIAIVQRDGNIEILFGIHDTQLVIKIYYT